MCSELPENIRSTYLADNTDTTEEGQFREKAETSIGL
jgi:hypothetical protein